jgi:cobalt-zinc-cadmium efflux system outer membrane protein
MPMKHDTSRYGRRIMGCICCLALLVLEQQVLGQVLTLDSILARIEAGNPELTRYDVLVQSSHVYAAGAKAIDPPQVGVGLWMTPYDPRMWKADAMTGSPGMGAIMFSAQQMIMNPQKLNANATYMQSMAGVNAEMKMVMRNELFAMAKMSYYEWLVMKMKLRVLDGSEALLNYLIQSTELRYTYGMDKLNAFYKAKAMLSDVQNMKIMALQESKQQMIALNTLMNRDKHIVFDIDTSFTLQAYEHSPLDTTLIANNRSDLKALDQMALVLQARQQLERSKSLPDFGVKFDHMLAFGQQPQQFSLMGMVTIPIAPWSSKMYKANVDGLNLELQGVQIQQQSLLNQITGQAASLKAQMQSKKQQLALAETAIIPAMKRNYDVALLAYEHNTEELFMVLDAWQNLKMVQITYWDTLMELLALQIEFEKQLEIR